MDKNLEKLKTMDRSEILNVPSATFGDYELLDLAEYFREEMQDEDREIAAIELILRSPLNDEMLAYGELYLDLSNYYHRKDNFPAMIGWAVAHIAYVEQNDPDPLSLLNGWRGLGEAYLYAGEINSGLGIFTRLITRYPGDIWNYNILGLTLPHIGLNELAVEVMDRGLALIAKNDPENLRSQFQDTRREAQANLKNNQERTGEMQSESVQALRMALALPGKQSPDEDAKLPHLAPLDRLITLNRQGDRSLDEEILRQGRKLIPELIHLGMDGDLVTDTFGPWHAARLLNALRTGAAPELEMLNNWLDRTNAEDWQPWIGAGTFGKIGGYTFEELEAFARDPQYGDDTRDQAIEELVKRANQQPDIRARLIALLHDLLNRENADQASEETFTANLIGSAIDIKAQELFEDIQRAFAEDRVDQRIIDEAFAYEELGRPAPPAAPRREDGLYLRLECKACNRTREHFTRFVVFDQTSSDPGNISDHSPYIMDRKIVCPKCGAVEQYRLPSIEFIKLMEMEPEQLVSIMFKKEPAKPPKPNRRLYFVRSGAFGKTMHPLDVIDEYQRRIVLDPKNGELYMRLGNTLRIIGRYEPALVAYRQAVELAPDNTDVLISAATAEHDFGDLQAARRLYEHCVEVGKVHQGGLNEDVVTAMQGLRALNKGEMSPWEYQIKNADDQPLMPNKRQLEGHQAKKDKRGKRHRKKK